MWISPIKRSISRVTASQPASPTRWKLYRLKRLWPPRTNNTSLHFIPTITRRFLWRARWARRETYSKNIFRGNSLMAEKTQLEAPPSAPAENPPAQSAQPSQTPPPPPPFKPRQNLRGRPGTRWLIIGAVIVLVIGGFFAWRYFSSYESTDDA